FDAWSGHDTGNRRCQRQLTRLGIDHAGLLRKLVPQDHGSARITIAGLSSIPGRGGVLKRCLGLRLAGIDIEVPKLSNRIAPLNKLAFSDDAIPASTRYLRPDDGMFSPFQYATARDGLTPQWQH